MSYSDSKSRDLASLRRYAKGCIARGKPRISRCRSSSMLEGAATVSGVLVTGVGSGWTPSFGMTRPPLK